jgi:hypothetical protein
MAHNLSNGEQHVAALHVLRASMPSAFEFRPVVVIQYPDGLRTVRLLAQHI